MQCHECIASQGGCKHSIAFLMWLHRRSEEPSCTSVECYWRKSKLSRVGTSLKYITAKTLSKGEPSLPSYESVFHKFLEIGKKRNLDNCEMMKYQPGYSRNNTENISMHQLVLKYNEKSCDAFLRKVILTDAIVSRIEKETRQQYKSSLWFELRYGRITASKAYEVSRCKTNDGTLVSLIMGGKIPDTKAMKRGRILEEDVRKTAEIKLKTKFRKSGLIVCKKYPMIAGSPDGICQDGIIEIKCRMNVKNYANYIKNV